MVSSKKSKKAPKVPPTCKTIRIIGPRPVEEEEESMESDFDPLSPQALLEPPAEDPHENLSDDEHEEEHGEGEGEDEDEDDKEDEEDEEVQVPMKWKQIQKNAKKSSFHYTPYFYCPSLFFTGEIQRIKPKDEHSDVPEEMEVL